MRTIHRSGRYYRVADPDWRNPADTSYSFTAGGRWNVTHSFGALYLSATVTVAAANARARHAHRAIKLFDLLPQARPQLVYFDVSDVNVLDAVSDAGVSDMGWPLSFPFGADWATCQAQAKIAFDAGVAGVATRSAAECTATSNVGEELVLFDRGSLPEPRDRVDFNAWYPDPIPG